MTKGERLKLSYQVLEKKVTNELKERILKSKHKSKHNDYQVIHVCVYDYEELAIVNGELTFFDGDGYHHSLYGDCALHDLIDILNA